VLHTAKLHIIYFYVPFVNHVFVFPSIVGIGEIALLPLDVLKIKRQTNPEAFKGRGFLKIVADEGMGLYR
jgi:hypothetical protein